MKQYYRVTDLNNKTHLTTDPLYVDIEFQKLERVDTTNMTASELVILLESDLENNNLHSVCGMYDYIYNTLRHSTINSIVVRNMFAQLVSKKGLSK